MNLGTIRTALESALREIGSALRLTPPRRIVAARVEGEQSLFPAAERITGRMLDDLVATFDPRRRRVPVTLGHVAGRKEGGVEAAPLGLVESVTREGDDLVVTLRSIIDPGLGLSRIDVAVSEGFELQSIGYLPSSPEVGGRSQLLELALLGSSAQGIPGLPRLGESGFGLSLRDVEILATKRGTASVRELFAAADVATTWKPFAGFALEPVAGLATRSADQFAVAAPAAEEVDDDLEVLLMPDPTTPTPASPAVEPSGRELLTELATQVRSLVAALTPRPGELAVAIAAPAVAPAVPAPAAPAPVNNDALRARAGRAARSAMAAQLFTREVAEEEADAAVQGGELAVATLERTVERVVAQRAGTAYREIRVPDDDGTEQVLRVGNGGRHFHFVGGVCAPPRPEELRDLAVASHRAARFRAKDGGGIPTDALLRELANVRPLGVSHA